MRMRSIRLLLVLVTACAPRLASQDVSDAGSHEGGAIGDGAVPAQSGAFTHSLVDGVITTVADATAPDVFRYLDLETGLASEASSGDWDLAFKRFYVITNGGISGSGGGAAARLLGASFESVRERPTEGWIVDSPDSDADDDVGTDSAFNGGAANVNDWYDYSPGDHTLNPRDVTFVVRSAQGNFFKVRMLGYYDGAGTPGFVRFQWAQVSGGAIELPDAGTTNVADGGAGNDAGPGIVIPEDAVTIDASNRETSTYWSAADGMVTVTDPSASTAWDLAFRRAGIQTNSGTSGPGMGGAKNSGASDYDAVTATTSEGFAIDELAESEMPGGEASSSNPILGDWFDYNVMAHSVRPKPVVWIVRTASGAYAKLRIWSWEGGVFRLSIDSIESE